MNRCPFSVLGHQPFEVLFCLHLLSVQSEALHGVAVGDHVGGPGVCGQQGLGGREC